jgi:Domain of unknown function (DUF1906)
MEQRAMPRGIDTHLDCTSTTAVIRAAGYEFVGRYYRMPQSQMTPLRTPESRALSRAGLSIVSIWEYRSGSNDHGGIVTLSYQTGRDEGTRAYAQAIAVPQSAGTPIYFCVDEGYDPANPAYAGPNGQDNCIWGGKKSDFVERQAAFTCPTILGSRRSFRDVWSWETSYFRAAS